jgi:hypothetical protein
MTSGRKAPPEEGTEMDPEQKWVLKELGRCPQRDDPSCSGGVTQENFFHKGHDLGILWIPEEIGHSPQRNDPLCRSGTVQGNSCQEKSNRKRQCRRSPYRTDAREETSGGSGGQHRNKASRRKLAAVS